ncbi:MAG: sugar kinase [Caulobacteraceae bacterium]|nr:sugar kinase [Caulobacteraceae bacterium]
MTNRLLCVGLTTLDVTARPIDAIPEAETTTLIEKITLSPAGTAGGAALVAAKLGVKTALASALGDDAAGRLVRMELEDLGIDTNLLPALPGLPTSTTILAIDSQGRRPNFHAMGASFAAEITSATLEAAKTVRFLHYGGVGGPKLNGGPGAELLATAKAAGATITCDLISPRGAVIEELSLLLPHVDYFMPNAGEAQFLSGQDDLARAGAFFRDLGAGACLFKNGSNGSVIVDAEGLTRLAAHDITPIDTTSCGDSYCAGFIAGLDRGWSVRDAARLGSAVAALVAQGLGTLGMLESFEAAETLMRQGALREITA